MLSQSLSNIFRYCLNMKDPFSTVAEEVSHLKNYSYVMEMRMHDNVKYFYEIDENVLKDQLPRITIQPLVENSFQHGIRPNKTSGYIQVCVKEESGKLHILVRDNGKGIPDDIVSELQNLKDCGEKKSLGLRGTIQRLKLIYENAFSFEIRNQGLSEIHLYLDTDVLGE